MERRSERRDTLSEVKEGVNTSRRSHTLWLNALKGSHKSFGHLFCLQ